MPHIQERLELSTLRLIPKLFYTHNPILHNKVKQAVTRKRHIKKQSVIHRVVQKTAHLEPDIKPRCLKISKHPPWALHSSFLVDELMCFPKHNTCADTFKQVFTSRKHQLHSNGWSFIYTDGSKDYANTAYAVVSDDSCIISKGLLLPYCSIFSAEAYAVKSAAKWAVTSKGKYTICTDSLSTIMAIQNPNNVSPLIACIRDTLIAYKTKIKLMWVPSHCGIHGNDVADKEAKKVPHMPCYYVETNEKNDILRYIYKMKENQQKELWSTYNNRYRLINPNKTKTAYPTTCSIPALKVFSRLRLGHCALSHQHLLNRSYDPGCAYCNSTSTSTLHILDTCPALSKIRGEIFSSNTPSELLKAPTAENISIIYKYISKAKLSNKI
ncbi:uncharacterized protein LOC129242834 [Anastrepha obliqua]|uniref:uncharacterized protein LOC129242834 n=1 Tax=Anastrepha obliqua TaxID=95512 RepID=UPI00240A6B69|nr:uncharacterized protein LOC129242834 [Anastrepha obliqua]